MYKAGWPKIWGKIPEKIDFHTITEVFIFFSENGQRDQRVNSGG